MALGMNPLQSGAAEPLAAWLRSSRRVIPENTSWKTLARFRSIASFVVQLGHYGIGNARGAMKSWWQRDNRSVMARGAGPIDSANHRSARGVMGGRIHLQHLR